jgi:putative transposase
MKKNVFFTPEDRIFFLEHFANYAMKAALDIICYCLMTNHTHLLVVPRMKESLEKTFKPLHLRYSQRLNKRNNTVGLNWQGRFFSSPLDVDHSFYCVQYILLNPVRAKLVDKMEDYPWSSARAHLFGEPNPYLSANKNFLEMASNSAREVRYNCLDSSKQRERCSIISRNTKMNIPCGERRFIESLEQTTGRVLRYRPCGGQLKG